MSTQEIIIVGAGASGLMCGYLLGRAGKRVTILEKNAKPGRKLTATGNGCCNFTNRKMSVDCYYGEPEFVKHMLEQCSPEQTISLFEEMGIYHREREGYCYPQNGQAATVVEFLIRACEEQGVQILCDLEVIKVLHKDDGYEVRCKDASARQCHALILATGGVANAPLGGTERGYQLAKMLSHRVSETYPGLTGLIAEGSEWKELAGVRMQGKISLYDNGKFVQSESGEIQLVKTGISGIPVFQLCRLAAEALAHNHRVTCEIDFFPELSKSELQEWVTHHGVERLQGLVHRKWVPVLKRKGKIVESLKGYEVLITDTFGMERAQVTAGGVFTNEVNPNTMESKQHNNLYLLGELLDVDGICGGYNLQFAWAGAYLCSQAIAGK